MSKSKLTANDTIPEDELLLAMLIAETKSRGWKSCRGEFFRDAKGKCLIVSVHEPDARDIRSCCVFGAYRALTATCSDVPSGPDINAVDGNDGKVVAEMYDDSDRGFTIGRSFYDACRG